MLNIPVESLKVACTIGEFNSLNELKARRLYLYGEIESINYCSDELDQSASVVSALVKNILAINAEDKGIPVEDRKPIFLYINSPGGDLTEGFPLIPVIEQSVTPVYTVNIGEWCSMAFLIGITGHKRFSLPYMTFLMHEASGVSVGKISSMEEKIIFDRKFCERIVKQHVLRHSKMKEKEYNLVAQKEFYMLPEDALEYGFIDEIVSDIYTIL